MASEASTVTVRLQVTLMGAAVFLAVAIFANGSLAQTKTYRGKSPSSQNDKSIRQHSTSLADNKRRWELRTAPIALLASWVTLDASYRFTDHWATGPAVILYSASGRGNMFTATNNGYAAGWSANYYFRSVFRNTWYISAHTYFESYKTYPHAYEGFKELSGLKANSAFGYQWKMPRINVMTGLGAEMLTHNILDRPEAVNGIAKPAVGSNRSDVIPFFEFKMGMDF